MWEKLNEPVTIGFFLKIMIALNIVMLIICLKVCWIRTTQDEEHLEYDMYLENRIETQTELIRVQRELINKYRN